MTDVAARHDELRPLMFSIAYRMLGSVTEAEDVTQEAFLRLHRDTTRPESPEAYAATVTTRLAIDHLRSARVRRERYVGSWLPEPLLTTGEEFDPAVRAEVADSLSLAFLAVLERLSPVERAVFLLREVFSYDYDEIAQIVGKTPQNCRQILARARSHVEQARPRFAVSDAQRDALAERFFAACRDGDLAGLERLLAEDVEFYGDGGGKAPAVRKPVIGRLQVARFTLGLVRQAQHYSVRIEPVAVNGQPGARMLDPDGRILSVLALDIAGDHVHGIYNVLNPDKLGHLTRSR
ncbi:MAG TPA: RNA polymerase sigma-70 factor [Micromonosporaceae bacterium]